MAGLFGDAPNRLMRETWKSIGIDALAQEIYAILQLEDTKNSGTVETTQQADAPSNIIRQSPFSSIPAITITRKAADGSSTTTTIDSTGVNTSTTSPLGVVTDTTGGGGGLPGVITGGSGNTYEVLVTTTAGTRTVTATQIQIAAGESIPIGSGCLVVQVGSLYFIQVPVWM